MLWEFQCFWCQNNFGINALTIAQFLQIILDIIIIKNRVVSMLLLSSPTGLGGLVSYITSFYTFFALHSYCFVLHTYMPVRKKTVSCTVTDISRIWRLFSHTSLSLSKLFYQQELYCSIARNGITYSKLTTVKNSSLKKKKKQYKIQI